MSPPSLDVQAALAWQRRAPLSTPWLHAEVASRMAQRLEWIKLQPRHWLHWDALRSSLEQHETLAGCYPAAKPWCPVPDRAPGTYMESLQQLAKPWWQWKRWTQPVPEFSWPLTGGVDMLWANMAMHNSEDPQALVKRWHELLSTDGFLMFSCLGPDTLRELRALYHELGWGEPMHALTDMHDYGDMLVQAGFAEPVMDMERIVLTFPTPERALQELRELGRNRHVNRMGGLRARGWLAQLKQGMDTRLRKDTGDITLTFEIIYGHAIKPAPRIRVSEHSSVSLQDMRQMLAINQQSKL